MAKKRGRLHPVSFQTFIKEMHEDPKVKAESIRELQKLGFRGFTDKHYDLITRQKRELDTIQDKESEDLVTKAIVTALKKNWPLELRHVGHNPPNLKIEIAFGPARLTVEC